MACGGSPEGPNGDSARSPEPEEDAARARRRTTAEPSPRREPHASPRATGAPLAAAAAGLVLALCLAAAPVLGPSPLAAQQPEDGPGADTVEIDTPYREIPRGLRVGAVGGYLDADLADLDLGPQSTPVVGLRGRARISSPISLEVSALYGSSDRFAVDPRLETGPAPVDTVTSRWILGEAVMQFAVTGDRTWHGLQPFVTIGGGFLIGVDEEVSPELDRPEETSLRHDIEIMPAVQAGLGAEWMLGDRFGLSIEARDHLWRITTPEGFFDEAVLEGIRDAGGPAPQETTWTHNFELSLTIYRYF